MKKFVALVVLSCAVMFSSTATAEDYFFATNGKFDRIFADYEREQAEKKAEERAEQARRKETYALVGSVTLTVGIITAFFVYKYRKNRQSGAERSFASWLLSCVDDKNFWAFVFCVISFVTCILYVPYNETNANHPNVIYKSMHNTIFDMPKGFNPKITRIDYEAIAFREVLILIGCCAGYTAAKVINKH